MNQMGKDYEKNLNKNIRKSFGKFYTPEYIIDYMLKIALENVDIVENPFIKILDPSCGTGHFLIKVCEVLSEKFRLNIQLLNDKYRNQSYEILSENSKKIISGKEYWVPSRIHYHIISNCLYGADIDGEALKIAGRILIENGQFKVDYLNLIKCDSLIKWEKMSFENYMEFEPQGSREQWRKLKSFWNIDFDFIIGNPPYVVMLKSELDKSYIRYLENNYKTLGYKLNIFYILIERSLEKLKKNGIHSFVVPDRYFSSRSYTASRRLLLEETKLLNITCFSGRVFTDAVVGTGCYVVKMEKADLGHSFELNLNYNNGSFDKNIAAQQHILNSKEHGINILAMKKHTELLNKICRKGGMLGDYCRVHVGMMIKDKQKHFSVSADNENEKRIILGRDMKEYIIVNKNRYFMPEGVEIFGGTKDKRKHERHPKLFLRKTGERLTAAIDLEGIYGEQSVYLLLLKDVSLAYNILGQLQGKLCNYVFKNKLVSNPGKYPYIQHYDALKLPITSKLFHDEKFDELVKSMISLKENADALDYLETEKFIQERIDRMIFEAYELSLSEIEVIENY